MRLSLSINGVSRLVAAVSGSGYLGGYLNLHERPKDNDYSKSIRLSGTQTLDTETIRFEWPTFDLKTGDAVEIRVLDDGEGDAPSEVRRSSESPQNLFTNIELAKELLTLVSDFESRLIPLIEKSKETEPVDEQKKIALSIGYVLTELGDRLLYPIYRRHKELVPDELKGELL